MSTFVSVQSRGTIALPPAIRRAYHLDQPGAQVEIVEEDGRLVLIPKVAIDAAQAWFWTDEWQTGEASASRELAAGDGEVYNDAGDFLAALP
ncbi:MAG: AbrB/MazE/SpoVT family DNA-binding domain-containing protein [Propionibacteriaceae bacterium]|nr:AbrB/MazE/SpoVT family DNA-binding domain-containing protein [Propionibacteriaceae bacterium]MCL2483690.1 AbrB/MazE/SpoVT family DNA-binding domain-containing protein [Propionibacteriaceae bacterium]